PFFFQAEDGIRYRTVTGVQTCALPISDRLAAVQRFEHRELARPLLEDARDPEQVLRALGGRDLRPAVVERPPRGVDCSGYVLGQIGRASCRERVEVWAGAAWVRMNRQD